MLRCRHSSCNNTSNSRAQAGHSRVLRASLAICSQGNQDILASLGTRRDSKGSTHKGSQTTYKVSNLSRDLFHKIGFHNTIKMDSLLDIKLQKDSFKPTDNKYITAQTHWFHFHSYRRIASLYIITRLDNHPITVKFSSISKTGKHHNIKEINNRIYSEHLVNIAHIMEITVILTDNLQIMGTPNQHTLPKTASLLSIKKALMAPAFITKKVSL